MFKTSDGIAAVLGTDCPSNFGVTIFTEDGMIDASLGLRRKHDAGTASTPSVQLMQMSMGW